MLRAQVVQGAPDQNSFRRTSCESFGAAARKCITNSAACDGSLCGISKAMIWDLTMPTVIWHRNHAPFLRKAKDSIGELWRVVIYNSKECIAQFVVVN